MIFKELRMKIVFFLVCLFFTINSYAENVVVVFDGSGSMNSSFQNGKTNDTKLDIAKDALKLFVQRIPKDTKVGILLFSGHGSGWVTNIDLIPKDIISRINNIKADGPTPLGHYMQIGANALLELRKNERGVPRLVVITDGEATDNDLMEKVTLEIIARGISIDVIGVDLRNHTLSKSVYSFRSALDADSLKQALSNIFAENPSDGDDIYAIIEPMPSEIAENSIGALTNLDNNPILIKKK